MIELEYMKCLYTLIFFIKISHIGVFMFVVLINAPASLQTRTGLYLISFLSLGDVIVTDPDPNLLAPLRVGRRGGEGGGGGKEKEKGGY